MANTQYPCDQQQTLVHKVIALAKATPKSNLQLFRETDIPPHWWDSLRSGKTKSPSANRVQFAYEYLSGCKLFSEDS